jgi:hypothetical protein
LRTPPKYDVDQMARFFVHYFRSAGGTSVISRAPRWKVT